MKNLIEPEKLQELKNKPVTYEVIAEFLLKNPTVPAGSICKALGVAPTSFYSWRNRQQRKAAAQNQTTSASDVVPVGSGKRKYSAAEKVTLVRDYQRSDEEKRGAFLRSYGLYHSDMERWSEIMDQAAIAALSKKKQGRAAKSEDQIKIEELNKELQGQEKVISKLSAMVVVQKKISAILGISESI